MFFRVCISVFRRREFFLAWFFEAYCGSRKISTTFRSGFSCSPALMFFDCLQNPFLSR